MLVRVLDKSDFDDKILKTLDFTRFMSANILKMLNLSSIILLHNFTFTI